MQGDGGQRLCFLLDGHAFFRFDSLMQAITPLPANHEPTRKLIHNNHAHFPGFRVRHDNIMFVAFVQVMGLEGVINQVRPFHVASGVETFHTDQPLRLANPFLCQWAGVFLFFDLKMDSGFELASHSIGNAETFDVTKGGAADDQRRAGFVNEDVIHFVNDGVV
ncbi:hypothetical protein HRbin36_02465 [bacterium HR36]|nr:hypothetical protein HRbin36_02465 [bacterium HR36]